jgi:CRP/FNR family cyclic AMP-dependent transcriptional regulator
VIRPWSCDGAEFLDGVAVRWNVLTEVRVALLDRAFAKRAATYPGVGAVLMERVEARAQRLAMGRAISHLTRVDERILAILLQLSERWGRVTPQGIALPLCLSHRTLGEMIGAARPSVSAAVSALVRRGDVVRSADGSWLLRSGVAMSSGDVPESVPQRRDLFVAPSRVRPRSAARQPRTAHAH